MDWGAFRRYFHGELSISIYLSLCDKNNLTNGISGFILRAMIATGKIIVDDVARAKFITATEVGLVLLAIVIYIVFRVRPRSAGDVAVKTGPARLARIKIASRIFRVLILFSFALPAILALAIHFGWIGAIPGATSITLSPNQIYKWPFEIPGQVMALALVRLGLYGYCVLVLNNLFRLYERGIFFSAKNVNYIRFLGYYLVIDWLVVVQLEFLAPNGMVTFTKPFFGLLIIFIAWIMDEGRKIQEEQELTV